MGTQTIHVVQAFSDHEGSLVAAEPKACQSAGYARALAQRLALSSVGVIA